ncbi:MAG: hypothetical protein GWN13_25420, partial [Phycisphaerae bacterium]|nr:hypothetical protein [Phycisphaerae bacterium]
MTHTVYDTGDNSEMVNVLPITATKTAIYSVEISDLAVGDILVIAAESEMTN